jgi:APA family basic amino acid/polyamine antiporter
MIGTGVFTSLGFQTVHIQTGFSLLSLWFLGGIIALCGALSYGELASAMPRSGGEYQYLSKIYHPLVGFLSGWVSSTVAFAAPIALASQLLSQYIHYIFPSVNILYLSCSIVIGITLIHMYSLSAGTIFQDISSILKVLIILGLIVIGLYVGSPQGYEISFKPTEQDLDNILSPYYAIALVFVMYAYSGWNATIYIANEIKNPARTIPISLVIGTIFVLVLYVLTNYVILLTTPIDELYGVLEVGYASANHIFGPKGSMIMAGSIAFCLISSISSMVWTGPRVTQAISEDVKAFSFLLSKNSHKLPIRSLLFQLVIVLVMLVTASFESILTYISFTVILFSFLTVLGVFIYRRRFKSELGPYRTWGYPITPLIFIIANLWMLIYIFKHHTRESVMGLGTLVIGALVYFFSSRKSKDAR